MHTQQAAVATPHTRKTAVAYSYFAPPQDYRFSIGVDTPAPPL